MHEASYRHTAQKHVGTLQSVTDQDAVKAADATRCSEERLLSLLKAVY